MANRGGMPGGSEYRWRKIRAAVLERDGWVCRLCGRTIPAWRRPPHPDSASVHHTAPRELVGDDPRYLVAAHRECNYRAGSPVGADPDPRPRTTW